MIGAPVEGGGEAGATVELALVAAGRVPLPRGCGDVAAQPAALGILLDPLAQTRPLAQQSLVGELDGSLRDGDEAAVGQGGEHTLGLRVALEVELGQRGAAAYSRVALALGDQAQHEHPDERPVLVRNACVGRSRQGGRRRRARRRSRGRRPG